MRDPHGLLIPLRRDRKRDFAAGSHAELLRSKVIQALMTEGTTPLSEGELPWRTNFGASLHLLRHRPNDAITRELARVYVKDALTRWVPGAELVSLDVRSEDERLTLKLRVQEAEAQATFTVEVPE